MIRVNLGNFISSCCLFAMVCGATFLSHRAKCLAGLFVLTPTTRCQQFARRRSVLPVPPRARCNCLSRSALQNFSGRRGIDIFPIFLAPARSTAVLPSIALGGKRYFRGPFFSTSCEFPNYVPPRKSGQKRGGVWYLLGNSGQNCAGCKKKSSICRPPSRAFEGSPAVLARGRGDAEESFAGRAVFHLPPFTFRPPRFAFRPPPSVIPKSLNP